SCEAAVRLADVEEWSHLCAVGRQDDGVSRTAVRRSEQHRDDLIRGLAGEARRRPVTKWIERQLDHVVWLREWLTRTRKSAPKGRPRHRDDVASSVRAGSQRT